MPLLDDLGRFFRRIFAIASACFAAALLCTGCVHGRSLQYPPFPDQTKRVEDPAKVRIYLIRPPGGMNAQAGFNYYGTGPAATGPKVDPAQWIPALPQFGIYPENPTPDSPWRMIGKVASGTYLCWEEPPRVLVLPTYQDKTNGILSLNLEAGNVYYLRATITGWTGHAQIDLLNGEDGQALLKKCKPPAGYSDENNGTF